MKKNILLLFLAFSFVVLATACDSKKDADVSETDSTSLTIHQYPDDIQDAIIYEVNIRQYTPEGTINAFVEHIPRLKELGVDILWLMPIHPIGLKNRKGDLGSYYAVQNYTDVNPDFGTKDDFANLVKVAHENGMLVILDWVANHTAWDNVWITEHLDWYTHDSTGNIIAPVPDWSDVADLNYDNQDMRDEMIKSLKYWVENFDIDGFRCDVAMMVPVDFWEEARKQLDSIKPVFMLAESETDDIMVNAFDMNYAWEYLHITQEIAKGEMNAANLVDFLKRDADRFGQDVLRMVFTSNHDENSWNGSVYDRFKDSYKTFAALLFVVRGMPLIYSGQEACLNDTLSFFYKDQIEWKECEMTELYKELIILKDENEALWNGTMGAPIEFVETEENENVLTFVRQKNDDKVLVAFNLSNDPTDVVYNGDLAYGTYSNYFTKEDFEISADNNRISLEAWGYVILIEK